MADDSGVESLRRQQRLVFRCVMDFLLDLVSRQIRMHDGDFTRMVVYTAAIQASRSPARGDGQPPVARAFSVRAIAQSLALPYETTRRKVAELETAGLAKRVGARGHTVSPAIFDDDAYRADCDANRRALQQLINSLHALNFDFDAFAGGSSLGLARDRAQTDLVEAASSLVNDFLLRVLDSGVAPHGSMLDSAIICTLIRANAELLTHDPELAWQYSGAQTPPPDHLRTPVTITELATALGLTHETVRRRMGNYRDKGWVKRVTGGYLLAIERMQEPEVLDSGLKVTQHFLQLLQSLRQLGLDLKTFEPA